MEDNLSIDLRKLKKPAPHVPPALNPLNVPPLAVQPSMAPPAAPVAVRPPAPPQAVVNAPAQPAAGAPASRPLPPKLPPKPTRQFEFPWWSPYVVGAVIMLGLMIGGYYIYGTVWTRSPFGATPPAEATSPVQPSPNPADLTEADILSRVGALMLLPSDETPAFAKVSDPSALSEQAFFKNAKTGDIVLMYPKNSKAILYDPVTDKILEVAPIVTGSTTATKI